MRACLFPECKRRPPLKSGKKVSYHRFPRETPVQVQWVKWVRDVCGMYTLVFHPSSSSLCCRHFKENNFRPSGRLFTDVFPTITPDDLDEAEKASEFERPVLSSGDIERNLVRIQERTYHTSDSPGSVIDGTAVCESDVEFVDDHELTDVVVEVQGDNRDLNSTSNTESRRKFLTDLCVDDFKTTQRAKRNLKILNIAVSKTRRRLYAQSMKIRKVTKSLLLIRKLVQSLRKEEMVTDEGQCELDTALNHIIDHINSKKFS